MISVSQQKSVGYVEGMSREQIILLPERLDDYVDEENEVRSVWTPLE